MLICRVCLEHSDKLISLQSDKIDSLPLLHMISEFTIKNTEERLPKYICEACAAALDVAYEFKRKYEDSTIKFIRQTSNLGQPVHSTSVESSSNAKLKLENEDKPQDEEPEPCEIRIRGVYECYRPATHSDTDPDENTENMESNIFPNLIDPVNADRTNNQAQVVPDESYSCQPNNLNLNQHTNNLKENESTDKLVSEKVEPVELHPAIKVRNVESWIIHSRIDQSAVYPAMESYENQQTVLTSLNGDSGSNSYEITELAGASNHRENDSTLTNGNHKDQWPKVILPRPIPGKGKSHSHYNQQSPLERDSDSNYKSRILRSNNKPDMNIVDDSRLTKKVLDRIYTNHHRGIRNFQCDVCFRWFKTKGHVKTHRLLHIQTDKSIKCGKCFLTFLTRTHFRNHKCVYD